MKGNRLLNYVVIVTLLVVGIALIAYPKWDDYNVKKQQNALLAQWDSVYTDSTSPTTVKKRPAAVAKAPGDTVIDVDGNSELDEEEAAPVFEPVNYHGQLMIGKLSIDSIDVQQPILSNSSAAALDLGTGNVIEDRNPMNSWNYVLAGHRGRSYGRMLNRLDELDVGDLIKVETGEGSFEYEVSDTFLVLPEDLYVLDEQEDVRELTLITCHPVRNPTHRLIIKATMKI